MWKCPVCGSDAGVHDNKNGSWDVVCKATGLVYLLTEVWDPAEDADSEVSLAVEDSE